jgi:hypothetical protein
VKRRAQHDGGDVVGLRGGLGNQLFQVAFARWLESRSGRAVTFDVSCHRDLRLDVLDLPVLGNRVRSGVLSRTRLWPAPSGRLSGIGSAIRVANGPRAIHRDDSSWGPTSPDLATPAWWQGYFQRNEYAPSIVRELASALDRIEGTDAPVVGIHVRRGDMVDKTWAVPSAWFRHALEVSRTNASRACVWSDDPDWCGEHLDLGFDFEVARPGTPVEHLAALSHCRLLVISRSTFSWWAARVAMEHGARVVFPSPWWDGQPDGDGVAVPASWVPVPVGSVSQAQTSTAR